MAATVDQKLLRQTKFPPEFNQKVDMRKVNVEVMKRWIAGKISEILGSEDDVVIELCFNLLEGSRFPDIKSLQISLTGFLDKDTPRFCKELWNLCLSAQSNPQGVPKELLEAKKLELIQEKIDAEKAAEQAKARKDMEQTRERDVDTIRNRERSERGRGRGGGRGGRGGGYDSHRFRSSRSPPPRRRSPTYGHLPSRREADTYVPGARGGRRVNDRGRSLTRSATRSLSRSPPPRRTKRRGTDSMSRSRSASRSRSPPRRRRRSPSSESAKSSASPPARRRRQRPSLSVSRSRSPPRRRQRRQSYSNSASRSRSRDRTTRRGNGGGRTRRSPSHSSNGHKNDRADIVRTRASRDDRRLSRSPKNAATRRQRSPSRSHSRSRSRSRSRSHSHGRRKSPKRRRSLQRWDPAARRRRNTSSPSSPDQKRRRKGGIESGDERPSCQVENGGGGSD